MSNSVSEQVTKLQGIAQDARTQTASQWRLVWWRFCQHRLALISLIVLLVFYFIAIFCEFFAPHDPGRYSPLYIYAPPQQIHLIDYDASGTGYLHPFVYGYHSKRNPSTLAMEFEVDSAKKYYLQLFTYGDPYKLWGIFDMNMHLIGLSDKTQPLFLAGADKLGRDFLSRLIYGTRVSLSIGLIGVALSFVLGILVGGISGYFGGLVDMLLQRLIEILQSIPGIPLWLTLSAVLPTTWSMIARYFAITLILSLLGWVGIARVVRGKFLALREEEFVLAAKLAGTGEMTIILTHLVPSFLSDLIARITLMIPGMIIGETALSFLGLGLSDPVISWGVLLQAAQQISIVALYPWLLLTGVAIVIVVLAFNFVGDGLRDAADPYTR